MITAGLWNNFFHLSIAAVQKTFYTAAGIFTIYRSSRCVFRCGTGSAPKHHFQCGRPAANPEGYDTHGAPPNSRTRRDLCSFPGAVHPLLVVFFELRGGLDRVLCFPHAFRSANSSSRSVYPFTDESFAILSNSNMAASSSLNEN
mgnify:CR=1 FL=1